MILNSLRGHNHDVVISERNTINAYLGKCHGSDSFILLKGEGNRPTSIFWSGLIFSLTFWPSNIISITQMWLFQSVNCKITQ